MFKTLSKTVAIISIMCSTTLFAQSSVPAISNLDKKDSTATKDTTQQSPTIPAATIPTVTIPAALLPTSTPTPAVAPTATPITESIPELSKDSATEQAIPLAPNTETLPDTTSKPDSVITELIVQDSIVQDSVKPIQTNQNEPVQITVTERQAVIEEKTPIVLEDSSKATKSTDKPASLKKLRTIKTIQSFNFNVPIESETWEVKADDYEWNSVGYQFTWTRFKTEESGYSTLFGLGAGFFTGDLKDHAFDDKVKFKGLNFNMKLGLGYAPISNELLVAIHFIGGVNVKLADGDAYINDDKYSPATVYVDATIGGDFIIGYQVMGSIGIIAGIDITTNAFGIGGYSKEISQASKVTQLHYVFSGINITPHIGIFRAF